MHAVHIVQDLLDRVCPSMHAKRRTALANVTAAATLGGLGVVRMGKKLGSEVGLKHRIKRCDRLLGGLLSTPGSTPQLKRAVIDTLEHLRSAALTNVLLDCLDDPDPIVQEYALAAAERVLDG
jgi:hypothetical protein